MRLWVVSVLCMGMFGLTCATLEPAAFAGPAPTPMQNGGGVPGNAATDRVGINEHLGVTLPSDVMFQDEGNHTVRFGSLFENNRPKVLVFAYHSCPKVCSMVLKAVDKGLIAINWTVGQEYDVVVVSFDPKDTVEASNAKRDEMVTTYLRPGSSAGFHFLTGTKENIDRLTKAVGYEYDYMPESGQYGHPAAIMLLSPKANVARYLYGLEFSPNDLRIGLLEASEGRSISTFDQVILNCYSYDKKQQKYVLVAWRVMRIGGGLVGIFFIGFLALFWGREWKRKKRVGSGPTIPSALTTTA